MKVIPVIKESLKGFSRHKSPQVAAATAYFTIFSLPAVLVSIIWLAGHVLGTETAQSLLVLRLQPLVGGQAVEELQMMIGNVRATGTGGTLSILLAAAGFIYGLVGAFLQLQSALDAAWDVRPNLRKGGTAWFVAKRLVSVLLVTAGAFLLLVSFAASVALSSFGQLLGKLLPVEATALILWGCDWLLSVGVVVLLVAAMFKILPDARVDWRDVWRGAWITSVLFNIGKYIIALAVSRLGPAGLFGAAGSMVVLMIWMSISMMILLLGAEIVQVSARRRGRRIGPDRGAVRVRTAAPVIPAHTRSSGRSGRGPGRR